MSKNTTNNKNMEENVIKLKESTLRKIIAESVKKALKEGVGDEAVRGLFGNTPEERKGTFSEIDAAFQERGIDAYVSKFFSDEHQVMIMVKNADHGNDGEIKKIMSQYGYGRYIGQGIDWLQFKKGEDLSVLKENTPENAGECLNDMEHNYSLRSELGTIATYMGDFGYENESQLIDAYLSKATSDDDLEFNRQVLGAIEHVSSDIKKRIKSGTNANVSWDDVGDFISLLNSVRQSYLINFSSDNPRFTPMNVGINRPPKKYLSESELKRVIAESVKKVLNEVTFTAGDVDFQKTLTEKERAYLHGGSNLMSKLGREIELKSIHSMGWTLDEVEQLSPKEQKAFYAEANGCWNSHNWEGAKFKKDFALPIDQGQINIEDR